MSNKDLIIHGNKKNAEARCGSCRVIRSLVSMTLLLSACISPFPGFAADIFASLAGDNTVESTYVSGRFAHNMPRWRSRTGNHSIDLSKGFTAMYNYQCYSEESVKKARKLLLDYLKSNPDVEVMMKTSQGGRNGQQYEVYERFLDEDTVSQLIIWSSDAPGICEIVVVDWNKGMKRDQKSNKYSLNELRFDNIDSIDYIDLSELSELSKLSELSEHLDLSGLEKWAEDFGESLSNTLTERLTTPFTCQKDK